MRLQDHIIEETKKAAEEAFRYALAVPADKVTWRPLDAGRSVLDQAQEMAKCPDWAYSLVSGEGMSSDEEVAAKERAEMESWTTVEQCKAECEQRLVRLFAYYKDLPDERLSETKWLPYEGGRDFTMPEILDYPRWNFNYHAGQIGYIQTLYGDKDMH